jgi:hypothetical protein
MNFFNFFNFALKSIEIPVGFYFQLVSITINFTDNRDYRPILNSLLPTPPLLEQKQRTWPPPQQGSRRAQRPSHE